MKEIKNIKPLKPEQLKQVVGGRVIWILGVEKLND